MAEYKGRLELTWTNKGLRLLAHEDGTYEWVPSTDYRVAEVRLLHDIASVGECRPSGDRAADNLLIRGDALHALTSLIELPEFAKHYVGKVKLCYVDPPFNTGQVFPQYDDALEHSVWLTMMRDRLSQIKELLAPDGSIWLHLDDEEVHRARIVLDEVFGVGAFVATIVWEKDKGRKSDTAISTVHDYLLVYSPNEPAWKSSRNLLPRTAGQEGRYRNPDDDPRGPWLQGDNGTAKSGSEASRWPITLPSGRVVVPSGSRGWAFSPTTFEKAQAEGRVYFGKNGDGMPIIKSYLSEVQQGVVPRSWWSADEAGFSQEAQRDHLRKLFPDREPFATPKPERLIERVIQISTNPGDVVLDCFVGSGTTAAVAQKMERRWVAVEVNPETIANFALPRLAAVVDGKDPGGITSINVAVGDLPGAVLPGEPKGAARILRAFQKSGLFDDVESKVPGSVKAIIDVLVQADAFETQERWTGGGGFRVLDVAPSMFEEDEGLVVLSAWAANGALGEATVAQLGYEYKPDPPFVGRKGRTRLAVIDGLVNEPVVRLLANSLSANEKLVACGTAIDPSARQVLKELRPGSTLRKIPASLLDEYRVSRRRSRLEEVIDWTAGIEQADQMAEEVV